MTKHVYTFANMNGKQCQVTTSTELSAELLAKYKEALGIACTHTVEEYGNDIARPVVVEPSREYDAAGAHIEAQHELIKQLEAELDQMTARRAELERWADQVLNDEYATGDEKKKAADVLRPDAVSLSAIKADTLEEAGNSLLEDSNNAYVNGYTDHAAGVCDAGNILIEQAAALREEKS